MSPRGPLKERMNLRHMGWIGCSIPPANGFTTLLTHGCGEERIILAPVKDGSKTGQNQISTKMRVNHIRTYTHFPS